MSLEDRLELVRYMVGDPGRTLIPDSVVRSVLEAQPTPTYAAAAVARMIAARFAVDVSTTLGRTKVEAQQRFEHFRKLAEDLENGGGGLIPGGDGTGVSRGGMRVGGISHAANAALAANRDRVRPSFFVGMDDSPPGNGHPLEPGRGFGGFDDGDL